MSTVAIENAQNTVELQDALEKALNEIGCELDGESTFEESREWFAQDTEDGDERAVVILDVAIKRWWELEG